jgi:hypothetical protein
MRSEAGNQSRIQREILSEFAEIFPAVVGYVGMNRPARRDRHRPASWRPIDSWLPGSPSFKYRQRPGRPRDPVTWTAVDLLADLYELHAGRRPGSGETGPFPTLVATAFQDDSRFGTPDIRKLIRKVLAARHRVRR